MPARTRRCPVCGTADASPVVYGLPIGDLLDDPDVVLGGCLVGPGAPRSACRDPACGARF